METDSKRELFLSQAINPVASVNGILNRYRLRLFAYDIVAYHSAESEEKRGRVKKRYDRRLRSLIKKSADNPAINVTVNAMIGLERDYFGGGGGI